MDNPILIMMLTHLIFRSVCAQWCEPLLDETWSSLIQAIHFSPFPELRFCPFTIEGSGCNGNGLGFDVESSNLILECDNFGSVEKKCVINCPGRHFTVHPGFNLKLSNFILTGATESSIEIMDSASLLSDFCEWISNSNHLENGGAIVADVNTYIVMDFSNFRFNQAQNAGAMYSLGTVVAHGSTFTDNHAIAGDGGALVVADNGYGIITESSFYNNKAQTFGSALYSKDTSFVQLEGNDGCGNLSLSQNVSNCNGLYSQSDELCFIFENTCHTPSGSPTVSSSPSNFISSSPNISPSLSPSKYPSNFPLIMDTNKPSWQKSQRPNNQPSSPMTPSAHPSNSLSPTISTKPSFTSSSFPSSTLTSKPSLMPRYSNDNFPALMWENMP